MAREAIGSLRWRNGQAWVRISLDSGRKEFCLSCTNKSEVGARRLLLASIAKKLKAAHHGDLAESFLARAASRDGEKLAAVVKAVDMLCAGKAVPSVLSTTFGDVADDWTSGKLAERFPDHVAKKKTKGLDASRLKVVKDVIGSLPVSAITLEHADAAMRSLPTDLRKLTRRQYAQVIHRVMGLCVYPLKLISTNPIPRGWMPKGGKARQPVPLYPDDDRTLLADLEVPLCWRIFYGFQAREGMREGESGRLQWSDLDMVRGAVCIGPNKTDDPRPPWAMFPGTLEAMQVWREICGNPKGDAFVFVDGDGRPLITFAKDGKPHGRIAERFRQHLRRALAKAGTDRAQLWESDDMRRPIKLHDLRALMVTTALANGRSIDWCADRTGHKSWGMIQKYRRAARSVAELGLGDLEPLCTAIPDLNWSSNWSPADPAAAATLAKHAKSKGFWGRDSNPRSRIQSLVEEPGFSQKPGEPVANGGQVATPGPIETPVGPIDRELISHVCSMAEQMMAAIAMQRREDAAQLARDLAVKLDPKVIPLGPPRARGKGKR